MDSVTHGLLGLALAAVPLPRWVERGGTTPLRASIAVSVLAAELPDLDYLLPAADPVLHTLRAHRGYTHALIAAPLVALVAALVVKGVFRRASLASLYARALVSVPLAHLLPDLWTGWGTRLLLPFSEERLALDWMMVIDPFFTVPLVVAGVWAGFRRRDFTRAMALGTAVAAVYLALRIGLTASLTSTLEQAYPGADAVSAFPTPLSPSRLRYVARDGKDYALGSIALYGGITEFARRTRHPDGPLPSELLAVPTVREAMDWARFPVVRSVQLPHSVRRVQVSDLRYHLDGAPTLTFAIDVAPDGEVVAARLDRGGSARELLERWRQR
jgi:inner membrane protein